MLTGDPPEPGRTDLVATLSTTVIFSFALGVSMITIPLVAIDAGYSAAQIGLLIASAAIGQLVTRVLLGPLMRRISDRSIVRAGCVLLVVSALALMMSTTLVVFYVSMILQGAARGFVWTASKTHMVRRSGPALPRLATNNLVTSIGSLTGPLAGGVVAHHSLALALALCATAAIASTATTAAMSGWDGELSTTDDTAGAAPQAAWRVPGIRLGSLAALTSAGWAGLMNGYLAVMLHTAGHDASTIGLVLALGNGGSVLGGTVVFRIPSARIPAAITAAAALTAVGVIVSCLSVELWLVVALALSASGVGAGALQTLAYAIAADAVAPARRSDAVVSVGLARAVTLLVVPLGAAGAATVLAVPVAVAATIVVAAAPILVVTLRPRGWRRARRS